MDIIKVFKCSSSFDFRHRKYSEFHHNAGSRISHHSKHHASLLSTNPTSVLVALSSTAPVNLPSKSTGFLAAGAVCPAAKAAVKEEGCSFPQQANGLS